MILGTVQRLYGKVGAERRTAVRLADVKWGYPFSRAAGNEYRSACKAMTTACVLCGGTTTLISRTRPVVIACPERQSEGGVMIHIPRVRRSSNVKPVVLLQADHACHSVIINGLEHDSTPDRR